MLTIVPYIIWSGLSNAIFGGTFMIIISNTVKLQHGIWDKKTLTKYAFFCMMALGAGEIGGSIMNGKIVDKLR